MSVERVNAFGQPIGEEVPGWVTPEPICVDVLEGRHVRLERIQSTHVRALYKAFSGAADSSAWTYLPYGPFDSEADLQAWVMAFAECSDPWMFAVCDKATGLGCGVASYLRNAPEAGSIEVGHIHFSDQIKQTRAATEAMFLMADHAFTSGYRRYEWKCDALNEPSQQAARRLGFTFEGIFRKATMYKGRNRDTAWFAIVDDEWQKLRAGFQQWLGDENFDDQGMQKVSLSALTASRKRQVL